VGTFQGSFRAPRARLTVNLLVDSKPVARLKPAFLSLSRTVLAGEHEIPCADHAQSARKNEVVAVVTRQSIASGLQKLVDQTGCFLSCEAFVDGESNRNREISGEPSKRSCRPRPFRDTGCAKPEMSPCPSLSHAQTVCAAAHPLTCVHLDIPVVAANVMPRARDFDILDITETLADAQKARAALIASPHLTKQLPQLSDRDHSADTIACPTGHMSA